MQIAIIEDEQIHMELLEGYLKKWSAERNADIMVRHFLSAESFLFDWEDLPELDVLFVDIQMKRMNGMDMARKVREKNRDIAIVFTTGITDYMEDGYEVEALHYLIKPIREEKVFLCMDKVMDRHKRGHFILVHDGTGVCRLNVEEIDYVEAMGHGTVIRLAGREIFEAAESFHELEQILQEFSFIKSHRSYLCNLKHVHHIDRSMIYFDDGDRIPVSRRLYHEVNRAFIQYFRGDIKS